MKVDLFRAAASEVQSFQSFGDVVCHLEGVILDFEMLLFRGKDHVVGHGECEGPQVCESGEEGCEVCVLVYLEVYVDACELLVYLVEGVGAHDPP